MLIVLPRSNQKRGGNVHEYENIRRVVFGSAHFVPVCEKCNRFVKPYKKIKLNYFGQPVGNNAVCKKHGRTTMIFEGHY